MLAFRQGLKFISKEEASRREAVVRAASKGFLSSIMDSA
jgi:hypothetical protein